MLKATVVKVGAVIKMKNEYRVYVEYDCWGSLRATTLVFLSEGAAKSVKVGREILV